MNASKHSKEPEAHAPEDSISGKRRDLSWLEYDKVRGDTPDRDAARERSTEDPSSETA